METLSLPPQFSPLRMPTESTFLRTHFGTHSLPCLLQMVLSFTTCTCGSASGTWLNGVLSMGWWMRTYLLWNFWVISSLEHQEELLAYDDGFSEVHTSFWLLCELHSSSFWPENWDPGSLLLCPAGDHRHNFERKEHVLKLTGFWEVLSVVFHSQTSSGLCGRTGRASQHMWHRGLGCKIYPAWQLVKRVMQ